MCYEYPTDSRQRLRFEIGLLGISLRATFRALLVVLGLRSVSAEYEVLPPDAHVRLVVEDGGKAFIRIT